MKEASFEPLHISVTAVDCSGNGNMGRFWLAPGSMGRAEHIANSFLKNIEVRPSSRGHNGYLGTLQNEDGTSVDVGIMSTGMGCPSTDIIVTELIKLGAKVVLRVGTAGSTSQDLGVGDVVIANGAVRDESTSVQYMPIEFPAMADFEVVNALRRAADARLQQESGWRYSIGPVHSKDSLYAREFRFVPEPKIEEHKNYMALLEACGCLASEMECGILFTLGQVHRVRTGAVLAVLGGHDIPFGDKAKGDIGVERACAIAVMALSFLKTQLGSIDFTRKRLRDES